MKRILGLAVLTLCLGVPARGELSATENPGNRPDRLDWFQDQGFGLFIHWSVDSQIGSVISHSLVGASDDYVTRYVEELPRTFNPARFDPQAWARMAKVVGVRYVVFTTKHHSGFAMWDTQTTDFNILKTPFARDATAEIVEAFRSQDIAIGFYFSPDDFHFLHRQGTLISRRRPEALPVNNPPLMSHNQTQITELYSRYGPVDVVFIDGPEEGLLDLVWRLDPATVVTRGTMRTPEIAPSTREALPDLSAVEPWEACFTLGTSWQYKPTNETYRPGREWIELLVETRAKGGNMLLNIGPTPEGEIPIEQENILREIGLWLFVNGEAIYEVRPWVVTNEGNVWFTRGKETSTVYAVVTGEPWPWGERREIALSSVRAGAATQISVLGQNDLVLEYQPDVVPETRWRQDGDRLRISAVRAQRLYNDRKWPNPVVFRITDAQPPGGDEPPAEGRSLVPET